MASELEKPPANESETTDLLAGMDPAEVHYFNRYLSFTKQRAPQG
jgi:hypothetical protein